MKSLVEFLTESSTVSTLKTKVEDFLLWYFGIDNIKDFSEEDIVASKMFDGNENEALKVIKNHLKDEIEFTVRRVSSEQYDYSWKLDNEYFAVTYYGDDPIN